MQSDDDIMLLNVPPRHGKSLTASRFVEWELGRNPKMRVATGSYNEEMAIDFSKEARDTIAEIRVLDDQIVFNDIFPDAKLKPGSTAAKRWALRGAKLSYLATSPGGSATGKGFDLLIIDDVIKGIQEATNENELQKHWDWFTKQMLSRVEKDAVNSGAIISSKNKNLIVAGTLLNPIKTYRLGEVGKPPLDESLFLWNRSEKPKMYWQSLKNHMLNVGDVYRWGFELAIAEIDNVYDMIKY
jgi:hypothetical protein